MRLQEFSSRAGISKRTVHFYVSKELLTPRVDPENGYIRIRKDRTGELFFEGQLREFTLDEEFLYLDGEPVMYQYMPVSSFSEDDEDMLAVVFYGDTVTSIIFRPAEDPEKT